MTVIKKRMLKKLNCLLFVFLFGQQTMFLSGKESGETGMKEETIIEGTTVESRIAERTTWVKKEKTKEDKEKTEDTENTENIEYTENIADTKDIRKNVAFGKEISTIFSQKEAFLEGMRERLSTPQEVFTVYIPASWLRTGELDELVKQLFPCIRTGNYYSGTVFHIRISSSVPEGDLGKDVKLTVEVKRTDSKEEQEELLGILENVVTQIEQNAGNDYEKIKMAHDYLIENVEYVNGYDGAYSALCLGKAVCNGYAAAFQLMMEELGIPCFMVSNSELAHVWNCVYLDGYWYDIDVTWDDPVKGNEEISYHYFLKVKDDFYGHGEVSFSTAPESFRPSIVEKEKQNGFIKNEQGTYYYMDGNPVSGWLLEGGNWYYFNPAYLMQTGWIKSAGKWYYLDEKGVMQIGWIKSVGKWYYLDERGQMQTGWIKSAGKWYYLDERGQMQTGWIKSAGKWYYLDEGGVMQTDWIKSARKWYYLDERGRMQTGWIKSAGTWYYLDDTGAWVPLIF